MMPIHIHLTACVASLLLGNLSSRLLRRSLHLADLLHLLNLLLLRRLLLLLRHLLLRDLLLRRLRC